MHLRVSVTDYSPMNAPYSGERAYLKEAIDKNLLGEMALT